MPPQSASLFDFYAPLPIQVEISDAPLTSDAGLLPLLSLATAMSAELLLRACRAYRNDPRSDRQYPRTLSDLVTPPFGGRPFVEPPLLADPWGNPFKYAVLTTPAGDEEVYVWADRVHDGRLTLTGAKGPASGRVYTFSP